MGVFALVAAINASYRTGRDFWAAVFRVSVGLVYPMLVTMGITTAAMVGGLLFWGRLQPADFGWRGAQLLPGLRLVAAIWLALQLIELVACLVTGSVAINVAWTGAGWRPAIGLLLAYVFGIALFEETFFRGFLLPQLLRVFQQRWARPALAGVIAVGVSQLLFAAYHLPNLLFVPNAAVGSAPLDIVV